LVQVRDHLFATPKLGNTNLNHVLTVGSPTQINDLLRTARDSTIPSRKGQDTIKDIPKIIQKIAAAAGKAI
jgi:hypothetical protein